MVECGGFENRYRRKTIGGSNPPLSAKFTDKGNFADTEASVKRRDKRRSERSVSTLESSDKENLTDSERA